jgi:hypothetical protein
MQNSQPDRNAVFRLFAVCSGTLGFVLSLTAACLMLRLQGNPAFLVIWFAAAFATIRFMRYDRRWRASFNRIATMRVASAMPYSRDRRAHRDLDVQDVVFRETRREHLNG